MEPGAARRYVASLSPFLGDHGAEDPSSGENDKGSVQSNVGWDEARGISREVVHCLPAPVHVGVYDGEGWVCLPLMIHDRKPQGARGR